MHYKQVEVVNVVYLYIIQKINLVSFKELKLTAVLKHKIQILRCGVCIGNPYMKLSNCKLESAIF